MKLEVMNEYKQFPESSVLNLSETLQCSYLLGKISTPIICHDGWEYLDTFCPYSLHAGYNSTNKLLVVRNGNLE